MTFEELTASYLGLESVKRLKSHKTVEIKLNVLNAEFGNKIVSDIKPVDLKNFQAKRKKIGREDATVDADITYPRTMINEAFDNNLVGGNTLRTFTRVGTLLKRNANARDRVLLLDEYHWLMDLPVHLRPVVATGFYTGMRREEILSLTWDKVDMRNRLIHPETKETKDAEDRDPPIMDELYEILTKF